MTDDDVTGGWKRFETRYVLMQRPLLAALMCEPLVEGASRWWGDDIPHHGLVVFCGDVKARTPEDAARRSWRAWSEMTKRSLFFELGECRDRLMTVKEAQR